MYAVAEIKNNTNEQFSVALFSFQLASKEYQKGFESPRVSEKTSLYASSSFRSETNGGSGDYTSKYKDVGACANTLSKLDGPVGFSTLPEQVGDRLLIKLSREC